MQNQPYSPHQRVESQLRPVQRQRSSSFPLIEALGCSTPEAQLILAEGRAAVRKRRARGRRNQSVNDESIATFDPRDHLDYLNELAALATPPERPIASDEKSGHARFPSNATIRSTSTVVALSHDRESGTNASPTNSLGDYSANLAQFIKAQLKSIPTYRSTEDALSPLSPRSCPDLSFPASTPPQSPSRTMRRPTEAPKAIQIPAIRPPLLSTFSAWSSTDGDTDDEALPLPEYELRSRKETPYTPSVLGYYEMSNESFLFSSTPMEEESESESPTARGFTFPDQSALPGSSSETQEDEDYPSSSLSRPQLTSCSAASNASSGSTSSYFDCKRPTAIITTRMKNRIIAAVTPPYPQVKMLTAISPWEGGAFSNVGDVFIESQHRVQVDGMSFDMLGDFVVPSRVSTPC